MEKPPGFVIVFLIIVFAITSYNCCLIWFFTEKVVEAQKEKVSKLPKWYPLRDYFVEKYLYDDSWISRTKVLAIVMEIFIMAVLIMNLISWLEVR